VETLPQDDDLDDFDEPLEDCYECGGELWIIAECFDDTCCCDDPAAEHDVIPCPVCNPGGRE
jgi:hypothetical protein